MIYPPQSCLICIFKVALRNDPTSRSGSFVSCYILIINLSQLNRLSKEIGIGLPPVYPTHHRPTLLGLGLGLGLRLGLGLGLGLG